MLKHFSHFHILSVARFVLMIKKGYRDPPYHNWSHAFSVTHFCYLLLKNIDWKTYIEYVCLYLLTFVCFLIEVQYSDIISSSSFLISLVGAI